MQTIIKITGWDSATQTRHQFKVASGSGRGLPDDTGRALLALADQAEDMLAMMRAANPAMEFDLVGVAMEPNNAGPGVFVNDAYAREFIEAERVRIAAEVQARRDKAGEIRDLKSELRRARST